MRLAPHLLLTALFLATPALFAADPPASQPTLQTIKVKDTKEFMAALGSNRIIQLLPGDYDLSEIEHQTTRHARWGVMAEAPDDSLVIRHVENLTIECVGDKPAHITTPDPGIYILNFVNATHLTLRNLEFVHETPTECAGGVLNLVDCRDFTIDHCTLSGSGTEGICAAEVDGLIVKNSTITHCSMDLLTATELSNAQFIDTKFTANALEVPALSFTKCPSVSFTKCSLTNNKTPPQGELDSFISLDDDECKITFTNCTISGNSGPDFAIGEGSVTLKDCTLKDNAFTFAPGDKPKPRPQIAPGMGAG